MTPNGQIAIPLDIAAIREPFLPHIHLQKVCIFYVASNVRLGKASLLTRITQTNAPSSGKNQKIAV